MIRNGRLQSRVHPRSMPGTAHELIGGGSVERDGSGATMRSMEPYMCFAQVARYGILYVVKSPSPRKFTWGWPSICFAAWLGPQTSPPSTRRAASGLLPSRIPTGATARQRQVHVIIHRDASQCFDHLQDRTAGADRIVHMQAELVAEALVMNEAVFCSNMMSELDFDESFGSVPLYIDNTSVLHVAGNHTYSPRAKHIALR